jgi:spore coat protein A
LGFNTNGNANRYNLLLAPGERADIIVDFSEFYGQKIILYNDAPGPFPGGDIRNDYYYYPGLPDLTCIGGAPAPVAGQGPDTRILMQFVISGTATPEYSFPATIDFLKVSLPIVFNSTQPNAINPNGLRPQVKTLNEDFDSYGRLRQLLGTAVITGTDPGTGLPTFGVDYLAQPTEIAHRSERQIWQIFNTTADTHPMHFHLVNVQVLSRQQFVENITGTFSLVPGTLVGPDPNELGWKETVRMNPGEVTTVIMKFDLPKGALAPISPRLESSFGIKGFEYVWHCHILEHEEHDMMRPLVVLP